MRGRYPISRLKRLAKKSAKSSQTKQPVIKTEIPVNPLDDKIKEEYMNSRSTGDNLVQNYFRLKMIMHDPERIQRQKNRYKHMRSKFELYAALGRYDNQIGTHLLFFPAMYGTLSILPFAQMLGGWDIVISYECMSSSFFDYYIIFFLTLFIKSFE